MLDNALDLGISEAEFWSMTFAELDRVAKSKERMRQIQLKEKAVFDYTLGILFGRAMGGDYPDIADAYPFIFNKAEQEQKEQERLMELSVIRFKQFANYHNDNFKEVASNK